MRAYHFECVQLLLDLLSEHRCETVAGGYFSTSVIFHACPSVMELYPRTEAYIASNAARCTGYALRVTACELGDRHEVVFTFDCNGIGSSVPKAWMLIIPGGARCTRARRVADQRNRREAEVRSSRISRSDNRRGVSGVCAVACRVLAEVASHIEKSTYASRSLS